MNLSSPHSISVLSIALVVACSSNPTTRSVLSRDASSMESTHDAGDVASTDAQPSQPADGMHVGDAAATDTPSNRQTDGMAPLDASPVHMGIGARCESTPCPNGLECQALPTCLANCPRVCVRYTESCTKDPCGDGAYCDPIAGSAGGTCLPRGFLGEPCGQPPGLNPDINPCADGLYCSAEDATNKTCVPVLPAGAKCPTLWLGTARQACVSGYTCSSTATPTCVPVMHEGDACLNATDCAEGLRCTARKCARPTSAT